MKKILALILIATMLIALVACGNTDDKNNDDNNNDQNIENNEGNEENNDEENNEENNEDNNEENNGDASGETTETLGQKLVNDFKNRVSSGEEFTAESIATALSQNEAVPFFCGATPTEAGGYFPGFDEYAIDGFKEGAVFMPMIGSIPFVGYVFILEDGADVDTFAQSLLDNCNPRWNICVTADETFCEVSGNTVFFLMSPAGTDEPEM